MSSNLPAPRYSMWQAISTALAIGQRAMEEVRALSREPGPQGEPGERGRDGLRGEQGPAGKLPIVRTWSDQIYYAGDVVGHDGATWQAQRDTARSPPHEDWICLALAGRDGADGASFKICGTWDASKQYKVLDTVILNGGAFVAKRDNPGACPGDGWQLLASQGKQGKPGEKGSKGERGERGEPAAEIIGMDVDDTGLVTLLRSDGKIITCDFNPLLSRMMDR